MRVLFTNNSLYSPGGAETFLRDIAIDLQDLGHSVVAYTNRLSEDEKVALSFPIPVIMDLKDLPFVPDIIHGQHHLDAMSALISLPNIPAIYHCHGAVWRECIPKHPRIYRYLAMSRTLAERISLESNISPSKMDVFVNGFDPKRFSTVRNLPAQPVRALFYNKHHHRESPTALAVKKAAEALGMQMDWIGRRVGRVIPNPESVLPEYDIVFASGRSAIEALACGCAVIVLGRTSCGRLVQPENFDHFRQVNFSIAVNSPPPSTDGIVREIRRYSATRCMEVTNRLRLEAASCVNIDFLLEVYKQVIEQHKKQKIDARGELAAISHYLRRLVPLVQITDGLEIRDGMPGSKATAVEALRRQLASVSLSLKMCCEKQFSPAAHHNGQLASSQSS